MAKRTAALYAFTIFMFTLILVRIYTITASDYLTQVANRQSSYTLNITTTRGQIYDRNFIPLTNSSFEYVAAVMPCKEAMNAIAQNVKGEERTAAFEQMRYGTPFLMKLRRGNIYSRGIDVFKVSSRYDEQQPAVHLVGYLDGWSGEGIRGIEKAFEKELSQVGETVSATYAVDVFKRPMPGETAEIKGDSIPPKAGVVLTLDKNIQLAVQAAAENIKEGAAVVMDVKSGDILAAVSKPSFSPYDLEKALSAEGEPLFNRVLGAYNVGSTFKLAVAAAALKQGVSPSFSYCCQGEIEVDGIKFSCHNKDGHGWVNMKTAIEQSCNPYFIRLCREIEPENLLAVVNGLGFGRSCSLADGITAESGSLYTVNELENAANRANFSFGQGVLTATPLQIAQMVSCIANGGYDVTPRLVRGWSDNGLDITDEVTFAHNRIIETAHADLLKNYMINVVENGSGQKGKPNNGGAGGKTASAQTGQYNENGEEKIEAWFAGFYPADIPKYAIVIFVEGGKYGGNVASPIFKDVADRIALLENKVK
ncbi:MAG: penicillin-binding protein 2 [Oscillospiraceae bacterium]|nr:penicillin-binding protein 2 [Oscillospiraceae bacterium]